MRLCDTVLLDQVPNASVITVGNCPATSIFQVLWWGGGYTGIIKACLGIHLLNFFFVKNELDMKMSKYTSHLVTDEPFLFSLLGSVPL